MKWFVVFFFFSLTVVAAQKAVIDVDLADIYSEPDFDSEIVDSVNYGETYYVSDKAFGAFYRIKLKNGKTGYVPDHEVAINGKPFADKPYVEDIPLPPGTNSKKTKSEKDATRSEPESAKNKPLKFPIKGFTLQLINYHEETMGSIQVDNLYAIGYRKTDPTFVWEVFASFQAPKYYAEKTGGSTTGVNLWGSSGFNTLMPLSNSAGFRYGGSFFAHGSRIEVRLPAKSYDLQDLTAGVFLEGGYFIRVQQLILDVSAKYFFDRNNYGAFGVSLLF